MKKLMSYSLSLLLCSALFVPQALGVTKVATGGSGAASNTTFSVNGGAGIQAHAFYRPLGTYFAGLAKNASANAVCYAERPAVDTAPTFSGIANASTAATNSEIRGSSITAIDVVGNPASDTTKKDLNEVRIVFLSSKANSQALPVGVHCMTVTGGTPTYRSLVDAGGSVQTVNTMTLVAGNQNTTSFVFAAVKDGGLTSKSGTVGELSGGSGASERGTFGATVGDGIACVTIDNTTNAMTQVTQQVFDYADTTSLAVREAPLPKDMAGGATLCYDETLAKLYVGSGGITSAPESEGGATKVGVWGVGIYKVDASAANASKLSAMVKPTGETTAPAGHVTLTGTHNIVGAKGLRCTVAINKLRVMHTSTGPSSTTRFAYLIVNGGNGYINNTPVAATAVTHAVGNRIWAIPLVVGSTAALNGTFAKVTTANFGSQAAAAGDLYLTNTAPVRVGDGPLPCPPTSTPTDMWVDGDAVYCSIGGAAASGSSTTANTPGVWYSQAYFDNHGKIAGWTEWAKAAPNELGDGVNDGGVGFIAVDGKTTRMWGVDNGNKTLLRMTNWEKNSYTNTAALPIIDNRGLLENLNTSTMVGDGCTAVCDLNASTTAWGATTPQRITIFGGLDGKICFAKTGSGTYGSNQVLPSTPGSIVTSHTGHHNNFASWAVDYGSSTTLLKTTVSGATGKTVTSLAYSGWDSSTAASLTNGYFFAGLEQDGGLYVWTKPSLGAGFNTRDDIHDFDSDPFRTATGASGSYRSWQKLTRCGSGVPVKIVSEGGAVYILMRKGGASPADYIVRLTRKNTGQLLNTDFVTTASTGVSPLTSVSRIVDFVVSTSASGVYTGEQLTMLTNDGIYTTSSVQGTNGIVRDYDSAQTNAGWAQVSTPSTDATAQFFLNQPAHTRNPRTLWYSQWVANAANTTVYNKNELYSLSHDNSADNFVTQWGRHSINAYDLLGAAEPSDFAQNYIFTRFYSDGSRRLFNKLSNGTYKLASRPYETSAEGWNMTADHESLGTAFSDVTFVYWMSYAGDTGKLLVGTNKGVLGLI